MLKMNRRNEIQTWCFVLLLSSSHFFICPKVNTRSKAEAHDGRYVNAWAGQSSLFYT